jgi:hypothetical protein
MDILLTAYSTTFIMFLILGFIALTLKLILNSVLETDRKRLEKFRGEKAKKEELRREQETLPVLETDNV